MLLKDMPIRRKLMRVNLLTTVAALLLMSAAYFVYAFLTFRQATLRQLSTIGKVIAANSTAALAFDNQNDAKEVLSALKTERHVVAAALYDKQGKIFARYPVDAPDNALPATAEKAGYHFQRLSLIGFQPVEQGDRPLGALYLKLDTTTTMLGWLEVSFGVGVLVIAVTLVVVFLLSRKLQQQISQPILALAQTAKIISDRRDYSVRATKQGDDELGLLTNAFNQMLAQIQERDAALRESDERLNTALKSSGVGTWSRDVVENSIIWDDYIHPLFGLKPKTFPGKYEDFLKTLHAEDRDRITREIAASLENDAVHDTEYRVIWPDGSVHWLGSRGKVYRDEKGAPLRMTGVCWDVGERKRAEEAIKRYADELKRSNQELEHFAYVSSHDLQEPLRTVASFSQLLAARYQGKLDTDADEFIQFIVDGANRMQTLIDDLLAFSRVGTRGKPFGRVECERVLQAVLEDLDLAIEESMAVVTHDPLPVVMADDVQLRQLLQNLIGNAIKFCRPGEPPRIHVAAARNGQGWEFVVRDSGIGIDPKYFDRIFIIFQRLHGRKEYPGTGIGLAVCKKIVERHGGCIWLESKSGTGSTFHFTLPERSNTL